MVRDHELLIVDNLENSTITVLDSLRELLGFRPEFEQVDIRDFVALDAAMARFQPEAILHFAAKKDPQESILQPLAYYETNVAGSINLLRSAQSHGVAKLVFSSSAAVYGHARQVPITEDHPVSPLTPYASSKHMVEVMMQDAFRARSGTSAFILRYFNPVGTHESGALIPHHPRGSKNLFPALIRAVKEESEPLTVHGDNLPTPDGTGIRDYIHVQDLAEGHAVALECLQEEQGAKTLNLGTGRGYSVREVLTQFEQSLGKPVPHVFGSPREGDPIISYAETFRSKAALEWSPRRDLKKMLLDEWRSFV